MSNRHNYCNTTCVLGSPWLSEVCTKPSQREGDVPIPMPLSWMSHLIVQFDRLGLHILCMYIIYDILCNYMTYTYEYIWIYDIHGYSPYGWWTTSSFHGVTRILQLPSPALPALAQLRYSFEDDDDDVDFVDEENDADRWRVYVVNSTVNSLIDWRIIPSGKRLQNYGISTHFQWENPL